MKKGLVLLIGALAVCATALTSFKTGDDEYVLQDTLHYADEKHFKNIQQLTFGGDNAEAYFSYDGKSIVYQKTNPKQGLNCDQIFVGKVPTTEKDIFSPKMISSGKGRTTCAFFTKDSKH